MLPDDDPNTAALCDLAVFAVSQTRSVLLAADQGFWLAQMSAHAVLNLHHLLEPFSFGSATALLVYNSK